MRMKPGPDPNFPYLEANIDFHFPDQSQWKDDIISIGGNLSPGMLLSAYEQGIFPWYNHADPIIWQSPDPRCVIFPEKLHVSASMKKVFKKNIFKITFDADFYGVIKGCAEKIRPGQNGTWITTDIIDAYMELYRLGWAHSAEAWQDGELAGGCYGVLMRRVFCGESMFALKPNASKAAFLNMAKTMFEHGVAFIDCQVPNPYLMSLGGEEMPRDIFLELLKKFPAKRC